MHALVAEWLGYLRIADTLLGVPLCVGGIFLMLGGWRLWKPITVMTYTLVGGIVGFHLSPDPGHVWYYFGGGALLFGAASFPPVSFSVAMLGGVVGAGLVGELLQAVGFTGPAMWVALLLIFGALLAYSALNLRLVIVTITAFEGAFFCVSGVFALLKEYPDLYFEIQRVALGWNAFIPFVLLVPTVTGAFLQMADVRQADASVTKTVDA